MGLIGYACLIELGGYLNLLLGYITVWLINKGAVMWSLRLINWMWTLHAWLCFVIIVAHDTHLPSECSYSYLLEKKVWMLKWSCSSCKSRQTFWDWLAVASIHHAYSTLVSPAIRPIDYSYTADWSITSWWSFFKDFGTGQYMFDRWESSFLISNRAGTWMRSPGPQWLRGW